ncbi:transposable element Tc1 transposase [Trichonephila clavipes]|nr:transposable element Tc1 transposase [Trichonephila clavipes]
MPPRRNKEKFQQLTEFERRRMIGLQEGGFSYRAIRARVQLNSSIVMRVWKQWTDEHRTTRKTDTSSRQLAARWSTATGVLMSTSSIRRRWIACKGAFIQDPPPGKPSTAASAMGP